MTPWSTRFTRLAVAVPRWIAEPYAGALMQAGAASVEERPTEIDDEVDIVLTLPDETSADAWQLLAQSFYQAFAEQLDQPLPPFSLRRETLELDYHRAWLERLTDQRLTDRIVFCPTTVEIRAAAGERWLLFEPHPSFGDGSHVTTRLAARATESFCLAHRGCTVLDVGTGNGVLSLVAASSGASSTLGLDVDPGAISAARHNAVLNQLESRCSFSDASVASLDTFFDLVVSNLEPRVQVDLVPSLVQRLRPGGSLILTGLLLEQVALISSILTELGWSNAEVDGEQDYALLMYRAPLENINCQEAP